jgi:N-methylhydantoinase A
VGAIDLGAVLSAFHERHRQRYGHADPRREVEIVNLRCRVSAPGQRPVLEPPAPRAGAVDRACVATTRQWYGRWGNAPVYDRTLLCEGDRFSGPAVVVQMDATTAIPPGWAARVDAIGSLVLEPGRG